MPRSLAELLGIREKPPLERLMDGRPMREVVKGEMPAPRQHQKRTPSQGVRG